MATTATFWNWFKENCTDYLAIDDRENDVKEELLDKMLEQLHLYSDELYFQIGGAPSEACELIITAEGNTDYFEKVEKLIADAPIIDGWKFIAFVPPMDGLKTTIYEDVELSPAEMWFMPLDNPNNPKLIGIKVCVPNYDAIKHSEWLNDAVYKCLDVILGEKVFALDIDFVSIGELPDNPDERGLIELAELPAFVRWKKKQVNN